MRAICVLLLAVSLFGCATVPRGLTETQKAEMAALKNRLNTMKATGIIKTQEQLEIEYASEAAKIFTFSERDYELAAVKIDVARRIDRGEISHSQGSFLVDMKAAEIGQRLAAERAARQEKGAQQMALGLAILGGAYSPPQQQYVAPPTPPPSICSSYVNGRYISTRCW